MAKPAAVYQLKVTLRGIKPAIWRRLQVKYCRRSPAYPRCMAGARACPPEDCGGIGGYEDLLAIIADPKYEQHQEMMNWLGEPFAVARSQRNGRHDR
jgi:Plasmid pRiA4b ORF-3-like protein